MNNKVKVNDVSKEWEDNIIDWNTFFRRNPQLFIKMYFGINLHLFQKIIIYLMARFPLVVLICARAVSKSFMTALFACSQCVLYPGIKVVVCAGTKGQAGLIITEKIKKELMGLSPNLAREIKDIKTSVNQTEVIFKNGSSFIAVVAGEQARGIRSNILIVDEFRLVKKDCLDAILIPTEIPRIPPYMLKKEYKGIEALEEPPREIYLSSAFFKSHWMWNHIKKATVEMYKGDAILFSTDYATTLKHGIKLKKQMEKARAMSDPITFDMEYNNFMVGGAENQYYSFDLINNAQTIKKAWYPRDIETYLSTTTDKNGRRVKTKTWFGDIPKKNGEIRVVSMDVAVSSDRKGVKNDYSVIKCIRALQNGERYDRQEVYIESFQGESTEKQAIRIRQIMDDFDADYLVIDGRTYGTNMIDEFAKILYDEERDIEYDPIKCFNRPEYADRCKNPNASAIIYVFVGTADLNDSMHKLFKGALMDNKYKMLVSHTRCLEDYLKDKKEWQNSSPERKASYEKPYVYSDLSLNEMINLNMELVQQTKIKLSEPSGGTKDKYITSAMANLFIQDLETNLTKREDTSYDDDDECVFW